MQRVLIIGSSGAGKSTLARGLGSLLDLPIFHLDALLWRPGWAMAPRDEEAAIQRNVVAQDRWIIDGNFGSTLPTRLARADTIVLLDLPRWLCLWRVLRRVRQYRGSVRPDMAAGCPEYLDCAFLRYVWNFPRDKRPKTIAALRRGGRGKTIRILRSPGAVRAFLSGVADRVYCRNS